MASCFPRGIGLFTTLFSSQVDWLRRAGKNTFEDTFSSRKEKFLSEGNPESSDFYRKDSGILLGYFDFLLVHFVLGAGSRNPLLRDYCRSLPPDSFNLNNSTKFVWTRIESLGEGKVFCVGGLLGKNVRGCGGNSVGVSKYNNSLTLNVH